jgi:hypothetical protein
MITMPGRSIFALALLLAACTGQPSIAPSAAATPNLPTAGPSIPAEPSPAPSTDPAAAVAIAGWLDAVSARDYERAATYFAPGARIGDRSLIVANTTDEIVSALRNTPPCDHAVTTMHDDGLTIWVEAEISGDVCPFVDPGESSHGILIPVQVANGKIICTCPAEGSRPPF